MDLAASEYGSRWQKVVEILQAQHGQQGKYIPIANITEQCCGCVEDSKTRGGRTREQSWNE